MKKILITLLALTLAIGMVIPMAVPAAAATGNGNGAVRADLVLNKDSSSYGTPGTVVGSVILNTTPKGQLIAVVNLDDGVPGTYGVRIWINGNTKPLTKKANWTYLTTDTDCLQVNAKGQGTANVKFDLSMVPSGFISTGASAINVIVVLRNNFYSSPQSKPSYSTGSGYGLLSGPFVSVPLK